MDAPDDGSAQVQGLRRRSEEGVGARRPDAIAVQEDHNLSNNFLLSPRVSNSLGALGSYPGHFLQTAELGLNDVEDLLTKGFELLPMDEFYWHLMQMLETCFGDTDTMTQLNASFLILGNQIWFYNQKHIHF